MMIKSTRPVYVSPIKGKSQKKRVPTTIKKSKTTLLSEKTDDFSEVQNQIINREESGQKKFAQKQLATNYNRLLYTSLGVAKNVDQSEHIKISNVE